MEERREISVGDTLPPLEQAVPLQKGQPMTVEELHALKSELQQLNVEVKSFKKELLTTRTAELEQTSRAPASKAYLTVSGEEPLA